MKNAVFIVAASFLFGLLGLAVAITANSYDTGSGPREAPMLMILAGSSVGVVSGLMIATYGLRIASSGTSATPTSEPATLLPPARKS